MKGGVFIWKGSTGGQRGYIRRQCWKAVCSSVKVVWSSKLAELECEVLWKAAPDGGLIVLENIFIH